MLFGGPNLRLRVGRSTLRAEVLERGEVVWAAESVYTDASDLADTIARLASEAPRACRGLCVLLDRPPVQFRTLNDLPPVKPRHLTALVAQQAGRYFRKNGRPLVTDAAWVGKSAPRMAWAAGVEEPLVEAIAAGARAAGLWLETIAPMDGAKLSLLPRSERERRDRAARKRTRRLAVTACAVWLVAAALFVGRLVWERRGVERELAAFQKPLKAVLNARRELRDAEATLNAMAAAERERGRSLVVLSAVTGALTDSSVLTSFVWNADGNGILLGGARRATDVVARLDRTGVLAGVRLGGPVVRDQIAGKDWERFSILFGQELGGKREGS